MPPAKRDPASILDAIIERAPKLHAAGIKSLSFEGFSVELGQPMLWGSTSWPTATPRPDFDKKAKGGEDEAPSADEADPLNDRATYGGGRVPGFTRPKKETI